MTSKPPLRSFLLACAFGAASAAAACGSSTDDGPHAAAGAGNASAASAGVAGGSPSAGAPTGGGGTSGSSFAGSSFAGSSPAGGPGSGGATAGQGGGSGATSAGATSAGAGGGSAGSSGAAGGCPGPGGGPVTTSTTHLNIGVHDPSVIWNGSRYDLFATGGRLNIRSSTNLQQWTNVGNVFNTQPAWIATTLGSAPADLWAPDVSYFNCRYHVYYAGSSFGSNNSVIGLATSPTLDSTSPDYKWTDQGQVVRSMTSDNYNAIDPNLAFDDAGDAWLSFGSFWSGIKLRKIDVATGKTSTTDTTLYSIAGRKPTDNNGAIEAPSIISHNGFYYLFVSYDNCCNNVNSTYRTMVGRAPKITGPYTNKAGAAMTTGAAEQLLATAGRYIGPGGGTAFKNGSTYLYAFHYYDGMDNGASKLQVRPINFDASDWPTLGDPLFP
ncbi:MAG: arabinan endo-1,5-alpha-L-arabinosidase [Myxococcales bacterium]|jgi:arabinan endo-1,5-alpha-L-arabinosidase